MFDLYDEFGLNIEKTNLSLKQKCKAPEIKSQSSFYDDDFNPNITAFNSNGNIVSLMLLEQNCDSLCVTGQSNEGGWMPSFLVKSVKIGNSWYNVTHDMFFSSKKIEYFSNINQLINNDNMYIEAFDGVDRIAGNATLGFNRTIKIGKFDVKVGKIVGFARDGIWYSRNGNSAMQWIPGNNKNDNNPLNKKRCLRVE